MAGLSPEELQQLGKMFDDMGVKPKFDSQEDLECWMQDYLGQKGALPPPSSVHVHTQLPRVALFSGDSKGDLASFDVWKYEINCLRNEGIFKDSEIYQAARKSLRGEASRIAMRLGPAATISELVTKLQGIYGTVEAGETLLAEFYSASQKSGETVASWGCRLEDIGQKIVDQGHLHPAELRSKLRSKFWMGLQQRLKDATRHNFEHIKDFDELRVQIRRVEHEMNLSGSAANDNKKDKPSAQVKMASVNEDASQSSEISELKAMVYSLSKRIDSLQGPKDKHTSVSTPCVQAAAAQVRSTEYSQANGSSNGSNQKSSEYRGNRWNASGLRSENERDSLPSADYGGSRWNASGLRSERERESHPSSEQFSNTNGNSQASTYTRYGTYRGRGNQHRGRGRHFYTSTLRPSGQDYVSTDGNRGNLQGEPQCWRCLQYGHLQYGCRVNMDHNRRGHLN